MCVSRVIYVYECKKSCPVVKTGKLCIEVTTASKIAFISEELCIGCGICVKKCPFEAIQIINLPKDLDKDTTHRYGPNTFKLHRLPVPRPGQVLGLVGTNGIGKSTALKVLAGKLKPNLGRFNNPPDWQEILTYFRGSELQNYFTRILEDNLKAIIKPQYVDHIPKAVQGNVGQVLDQKDERDMKAELCNDLELNQVIDRNVGDLSGGELQRFAIAVVAIQNAEIYMFDEPSSYLDVKQRLKAAQVVRSLLRPNSYVIVVEHDLSVLDYLSDFICCLYGKPGAYGVVTLPFSVREGINIFLAGFVPTENLRFRDESLTFKVAETPQESAEEIETYARYKYPTMSKTQGNFKLRVMEGEFTDSQIIVMLGENGTGKTTFIRMLAGLLKPDTIEGSDVEIPEFNVSYKPQKISPKFQSTVRHLLHQKIRDSYMHPQFVSDVMKPLQIEQLMDQEVVNLSGGELQRVALCLCLGKIIERSPGLVRRIWLSRSELRWLLDTLERENVENGRLGFAKEVRGRTRRLRIWKRSDRHGETLKIASAVGVSKRVIFIPEIDRGSGWKEVSRAIRGLCNLEPTQKTAGLRSFKELTGIDPWPVSGTALGRM
ncbi:hypothetical protein F0562_013360 [Nyssa sinensis]|uniref:ABC transporter domain-containing protein n=1 Tax=Nyssa sinensis TaxID=561372 RepID=A0A5J4ZMS0_9ASTE|nr:hypothetical protein F0562_013360 [Nyssa sinensis]